MFISAEIETNSSFKWLTTSDTQQVQDLLTKGQHASRTIKRASILRQTNLGFQCKTIIAGLQVSASTISRTRSKYRKNGLQSALYEKNRSGRPTKISLQLRSEVRLLACSPVPAGRCKWTGDLLLEQGLKKYHWMVSRSTIYRILASDDLKPWTKQEWCISSITPRYLEAMYNVLKTYEQKYDPQKPVVCVDELSKQVESSLVPSDPMVREKPLREDYSYRQIGSLMSLITYSYPSSFIAPSKVLKKGKCKKAEHVGHNALICESFGLSGFGNLIITEAYWIILNHLIV